MEYLIYRGKILKSCKFPILALFFPMVLFFQILLFFPMLPQWLPPGHSAQSPPRSGNFSAHTSASLHPSCSAAPAPLSLCCTGSLTLRCTGSLTLRCTGAPAGRQPHLVPQVLRCTGAPCRQHLMGASSSALYRRPLPATPHGRLKLCAVPAPPAGNKPHLAAKSTPVWLAIWRTWAGFANSQLRCAAFSSTY